MKRYVNILSPRQSLIALAALLLCLFLGTVSVNALGQRYFDDTSGDCDMYTRDALNPSDPTNIQPMCNNVNRNVRLITGQSTNVPATINHFRAYYRLPAKPDGTLKSSAFPNGQVKLTIIHGNYCPSSPAPGGISPIGSGHMLDVKQNGYYENQGIPGGTVVTKFIVGTHVEQGVVAVDCSGDKQISLVPGDFQVADGFTTSGGTNVFYVNFEAEYKSPRGNTGCNPSNTNSCDGIANSFVLNQSSNGPYDFVIANVKDTSGYGATVRDQDPNQDVQACLDAVADKKAGRPIKQRDKDNCQARNISLRVPFGADCTISTDVRKSVYLYDLDFGEVYGQVKLQLKRIKPDGSEQWLGNSGDNDWRNNRTTARSPASNNRSVISVDFVASPGYKYEFYIVNVNPILVQTYSTPFDGVYYKNPCTGWGMTPASLVDGQEGTVIKQPGQTASFAHAVLNRGPLKTAVQIRGGAEWTRGGAGYVTPPNNYVTLSSSVPSGANNPYNRKFDPGDADKVGYIYNFTVPSTANNGDKYCQRMTATPSSDVNNAQIASEEVCVEVQKDPTVCTPPTVCASVNYVNIKPFVEPDPAGDVEPGVPASFKGYAMVSNFPTTPDWGVREEAQQLRAKRVDPVKRDGLQFTTDTQPATSGPHYWCSNGASPNACKKCVSSPGTPASVDCPKDKRVDYGTLNFYYNCPSGYSDNRNGTCSATVYRCERDGGGYTLSPPASCDDYYTCEGNVPATGWHADGEVVLCDRWYCRYADSPAYDQSAEPTCEARCNGGTALASDIPGRPQLANGPYYTSPDIKCYIPPEFTIVCQFTDMSGIILSTTAAEIVNSGNSSQRHCESTVTPPGQLISTRICVRYKVIRPTNGSVSWNTSPDPGLQLGVRKAFWKFQVEPPAETCTKVAGKPYFKIYGGDAVVGGGVGALSTSCETSLAAKISGWNRTDYQGAGVQLAAMATSSINGFASAQSPGRTPAIGVIPRSLSFANTTGAIYGGDYNGSLPCTGFLENLPSGDGVTTYTSAPGNVIPSQTLSTIPAGQPGAGTGRAVVYHITGDVFIPANITYDTSAPWSSPSEIPSFQLIVEGNIYISNDVTQLDGLYAAIGGKVYTCANAIGSVPDDSFAGCPNQLVVNGSLAAKQVLLLRGCGSLRYSYNGEPTPGAPNYSGTSGDVQTCSGGNHAAEVINYMPEQWIRSAFGLPPDRYDSISSLPPIL
jgi:hypothetical protein